MVLILTHVYVLTLIFLGGLNFFFFHKITLKNKNLLKKIDDVENSLIASNYDNYTAINKLSRTIDNKSNPEICVRSLFVKNQGRLLMILRRLNPKK